MSFWEKTIAKQSTVTVEKRRGNKYLTNFFQVCGTVYWQGGVEFEQLTITRVIFLFIWFFFSLVEILQILTTWCGEKSLLKFQSPERVFAKILGRDRRYTCIKSSEANFQRCLKSFLSLYWWKTNEPKNPFSLAFVWLVFLHSCPFHSSSLPLSAFPIYTRFWRKPTRTLQNGPFEGWNILWKCRIVKGALWKFPTAHSHTTLRVHTCALRRTLQLSWP